LPGQDKSAQVKNYIVVGLVIVAMIVAYFRFFHGKNRPQPGPEPVPAASAEINLSQLQAAAQMKVSRPEWSVPGPYRPIERDIFAPVKKEVQEQTAASAETQIETTPPPLDLALQGTIVTASKRLAIINGQFLRIGDAVGEYEIVGIEKNRVVLGRGDRRWELEMGRP